jgi:hypothetical protein
MKLLAGFLSLVSLGAAEPVSFNRDIRPILSDKCFHCHGPDASTRKTKLRLDVEEGAKITLAQGRHALLPGKPEESEVFKRITTSNKAQRMPPAYASYAPLTSREIELIRRWIEQGASWQPHWSLIPPRRPSTPAVNQPAWVRNPIDAFILARLERDGLAPAPEASRATLIRRLSLDLTGLPPSPAEVDHFLHDTSPDAYEKLVDRLLQSPRYAERMAIRWLEAARYADTNGYQSDGVRDMWRWRDWVIDAFRRNMPFDQFTIEQLAGDLLPNPTLAQRIATGFHRNHRTSAEGGIVDEEFRVEYVADRVETTATVWLGLTMGCARCHDHKYDPLRQKDFYQLFAFFNNLPEKGFVYNFGNEEPYIKAPVAEQQQQLARLDRAVHHARLQWAQLAGRPDAGPPAEFSDAVARGQILDPRQSSWSLAAWSDSSPLGRAEAAWLHRIARQRRRDWLPSSGLLLNQRLASNNHFDGRRDVNLGTAVARFNHRDPLTLSARIRPAAPTGAILSRTEDYFEGTGYALYLIDGRLRFHFVFRWTDLGLRVETEQPVPLDQWSHVAVTYDGNMKAKGVRIYLNGVEQKLKVLFDQHLWPVDNKVPFRIGAGGGDDYRFRGQIDDVRVWSRELDPLEVSAISTPSTLAESAQIPPALRTPAQSAKLRLAFLDEFLPPEFRAARDQVRAAELERASFFSAIPTVMVMVEGPPRPAYLLKRGAYDAHGEQVHPEVPAILPPLPPGAPRNRLALAQWLVSPQNPLTARVTVNRFWQMLFGNGLVKTVEDFGSQGEWPIHPELLDWLAVEFIESGWNIRHILKTIVTSSTYRQSSRVTPELLERDPDNRLLARAPRLRLPAEMIRDQALAVSGLLVEKLGGPSVKPYQPPGLWQELTGGAGYKPDSGDGLYRRSLYTYWRRTIAPPSMINFDSPTRETCTVREGRTNTPLQALTLMNDVIFVEAARKLAERMILDGGAQPAARLDWGFRRVLSRPPSPPEMALLESALHDFSTRYRFDRDDAIDLTSVGDSTPPPSLDRKELAAYTAVASLLLNLDEAVTKP